MNHEILIAVCVLALAGFGCAATKNEPKAPVLVPFSGDQETQAQDVATKFANGFYASLKSGDFTAWQQVMPTDLARPVTAEKFKAMRDDLLRIYGVPAQFTRLNVVRNGKLRDYLWRITFTVPEKVMPPAKPKNEPCDVVWGVRVYCEKGKPPQVGGFRFYPFAMPERKK